MKSPVPGDVKTKLIPHLTGLEAAALYRCFVVDILRRLAPFAADARLQLAYQPHARASDLSWLPSHALPETFHQEGKSLGERLQHAFGSAFGRGARAVMVVGTDCPTLPALYLEQGWQALDGADVVLGPTSDGGYYLIGLSRPCLNLFDDVSWSGDQVFERATRSAQRQGYSVRVLAPHQGVETIEDLRLVYRNLCADGTCAPETARFLNTLARTNPALVSA